MKRYLQACEIGGSIYGKRGTGNKNPKTEVKKLSICKLNISEIYSNFYKAQAREMDRIFHRDK